MFIVIYNDDAYGCFQSYQECYDWAYTEWNGRQFSIYEVKLAWKK